MEQSALIYCVEDDESIRQMICYALESSGYQAEGFDSGQPFWQSWDRQPPQLVLLDIMLPGEDGMEILRRIKSGPSAATPVIMLTAKSAELDKVAGLDAGADDYITKPFSVLELLSRVRAVLRRADRSGAPLRCGSITLDPLDRSVFSGGKPVELTHKEFELLFYMMRCPGEALSRIRLMEKVWGFDFQGESRTVDMHIKALRRKLGPGGAAIKTIRGAGYMIVREE